LLIAVVSVGVILAAIVNKRREVQKARDAHLAATAG
jgi:putrescine transport system permease protein